YRGIVRSLTAEYSQEEFLHRTLRPGPISRIPNRKLVRQVPRSVRPLESALDAATRRRDTRCPIRAGPQTWCLFATKMFGVPKTIPPFLWLCQRNTTSRCFGCEVCTERFRLRLGLCPQGQGLKILAVTSWGTND